MQRTVRGFTRAVLFLLVAIGVGRGSAWAETAAVNTGELSAVATAEVHLAAEKLRAGLPVKIEGEGFSFEVSQHESVSLPRYLDYATASRTAGSEAGSVALIGRVRNPVEIGVGTGYVGDNPVTVVVAASARFLEVKAFNPNTGAAYAVDLSGSYANPAFKWYPWCYAMLLRQVTALPQLNTSNFLVSVPSPNTEEFVEFAADAAVAMLGQGQQISSITLVRAPRAGSPVSTSALVADGSRAVWPTQPAAGLCDLPNPTPTSTPIEIGTVPPYVTAPPSETVPPYVTAPPSGTVPPYVTAPPSGTVPPGNTVPPGSTVPPAETAPPGSTVPPGNTNPPQGSPSPGSSPTAAPSNSPGGTNTPKTGTTPQGTNTPQRTNTPVPTNTTRPTNTPVPPTNTPVPPTNTPIPPTATPPSGEPDGGTTHGICNPPMRNARVSGMGSPTAKDSNGVPLKDVYIQVRGLSTRGALTNAAGNFEPFEVSLYANMSVDITYSKAGYRCSPGTVTYNMGTCPWSTIPVPSTVCTALPTATPTNTPTLNPPPSSGMVELTGKVVNTRNNQGIGNARVRVYLPQKQLWPNADDTRVLYKTIRADALGYFRVDVPAGSGSSALVAYREGYKGNGGFANLLVGNTGQRDIYIYMIDVPQARYIFDIYACWNQATSNGTPCPAGQGIPGVSFWLREDDSGRSPVGYTDGPTNAEGKTRIWVDSFEGTEFDLQGARNPFDDGYQLSLTPQSVRIKIPAGQPNNQTQLPPKHFAGKKVAPVTKADISGRVLIKRTDLQQQTPVPATGATVKLFKGVPTPGPLTLVKDMTTGQDGSYSTGLLDKGQQFTVRPVVNYGCPVGSEIAGLTVEPKERTYNPLNSSQAEQDFLITYECKTLPPPECPRATLQDFWVSVLVRSGERGDIDAPPLAGEKVTIWQEVEPSPFFNCYYEPVGGTAISDEFGVAKVKIKGYTANSGIFSQTMIYGRMDNRLANPRDGQLRTVPSGGTEIRLFNTWIPGDPGGDW